MKLKTLKINQKKMLLTTYDSLDNLELDKPMHFCKPLVNLIQRILRSISLILKYPHQGQLVHYLKLSAIFFCAVALPKRNNYSLLILNSHLFCISIFLNGKICYIKKIFS